jgi:predicted DNA-binding transcriptional regulator YafY
VFNFDKELYDSAPPAELVQSIESINNAIAMGIPLTFVYSGYRSFRRIVDPVALIQSRGNYYLTAFCRKALAERTFRLDKISQLTAFEGGKSKARSAQAVS